MSRPVLLVCLLVVLIITSQFEWNQQLLPELDSTTPTISQNPSLTSKREEAVKEKIILLQEKNIKRLNEVVRSLREQLQRCKSNNETRQHTVSFLSEHVGVQHQIFKD